MQLFDRDGAWNWVDSANVVLGFRNEQDCCEQFGYCYRSELPSNPFNDEGPSLDDPDLSTYSFDPAFCLSLPTSNADSGGARCFRLLSPSLPPLYLIIFNFHNGYYAHGFTFSGNPPLDGSL